jgi:hypothetical protein
VTLFQQTTTTLTQAKQQIADAAGVSADTDWLTRAGRSYEAAIKHWNNVANWRALETELNGLAIIAPFAVSGCALTSGSSTITTTVASGFSLAGVAAYDLLTGSGTVHDMQVSATGVTSITATLAASATVTGVSLTFTRDLYDLPADFKALYTARLMSQPRPLKFLGRRIYDRVVYDQMSVASPEFYDLFPVGRLGKLRLIPPPSAADTLKIRYYRRMSQTADPIDVHIDWEPYFIAWAKWHMLIDKGGNSERANTWLQFATDGIGQMNKQNKNVPDEELSFMPATTTLFTNPNTTTYAFTGP